MFKKEDGAIVATGTILFLGFTLPGNIVAKVKPKEGILAFLLSDWLFHFAGLALFTFVLAWNMEMKKRDKKNKFNADEEKFNIKKKDTFPYFLVAFFSLAYALFIEIIQIFLPHRTFDFKDLGWDALGIALVLAVIYLFKERRFKPAPKAQGRGFE